MMILFMDHVINVVLVARVNFAIHFSRSAEFWVMPSDLGWVAICLGESSEICSNQFPHNHGLWSFLGWF